MRTDRGMYFSMRRFVGQCYISPQVIGNVFRKSLRLSGRARLDHGVGQITTMILADSARLDRFATYGHNLWVSPIQVFPYSVVQCSPESPFLKDVYWSRPSHWQSRIFCFSWIGRFTPRISRSNVSGKGDVHATKERSQDYR